MKSLTMMKCFIEIGLMGNKLKSTSSMKKDITDVNVQLPGMK